MNGDMSGGAGLHHVGDGGMTRRAGLQPGHAYMRYHPKWYRRRMSVWWWLQKGSYAQFVLRELTSVAVAFFAFIFLWQVWALGQGPQAYAHVVARLGTPLAVVLSVVGFVLVLYHTVTWFNLAPAAMVVRVSGRRVPGWMVAAANYAAWVLLSAVVAWFFLGANQ
ncbi:MAG: fumarate reductase subunit C [Luteitalea sp.]|nr:fumarate reductase subunit C [Luteitalea sp.]